MSENEILALVPGVAGFLALFVGEVGTAGALHGFAFYLLRSAGVSAR